MPPQNPKKPAILYFGNDWFAENRTSSHHIATNLAQQYSVYYFECPGLRAPKGSARDCKKIWAKVGKFFRGAQSVEEGLKVRTLLQIPLHRFAIVRKLNFLLMWLTVRWLIWREGIQQRISWYMVPHPAPLAGHLGEDLVVYYCIDDYAALPDVNVAAVTAMDESLTRKADIVFVASSTLLESKQRLNSNTHLSPHGVDVEHFARAQDRSIGAPEEFKSLSKPIIGFFGLIERWIDLDLVAYLAEQRPAWSFVMIGRVAVPSEDVPNLPNLHFLGKRPYGDLPRYGSQFDAAIIPYRLTQQVLHANPLKLREYLAMGKPIVSVSTPEIDDFADVVRIARTREEFLAELDATLAAPDRPVDIQRRLNFVSASSWENRVHEVMDTVLEELEKSETKPHRELTTVGS